MVFFLLDLKVENLEPGLIQQINTYTVTWTNETTDNSHLIRSLTINGKCMTLKINGSMLLCADIQGKFNKDIVKIM